MRIAYIGPAKGNSLCRANALRRLGHEVHVIDPWAWLGTGKWTSRWLFHLSGIGSNILIGRRLFSAVAEVKPDLIIVNQGGWLGRGLIRKLRMFLVPIINYTNDDPFGGRDGRRFRAYLSALPEYDIIAVVRECNVTEALEYGAQNVQRVWMTADEVAHNPYLLSDVQLSKFKSEVAFIGTWMPERGQFMAELIRHGVPLSIWGDRWQKAPEWPQIAPSWRGHGLFGHGEYAAAILAAKINLGLLSKGNRDLHTRRSMEIPALGGLFCAERTSEHMELYEDGKEAVFWDNAAECAEACHWLLANEYRQKEIASNGHKRAIRNNHFNEPVMKVIIEAAFEKADIGQ